MLGASRRHGHTSELYTRSSPGTEAAADAAAALASTYIVFKSVDSNYSTKLLNGSQSDELLWVATWLYKATKDNQYLEFVSNNQGWSQAVSEFSWDNKFPGARTLLAKEYLEGKNTSPSKYKTHADSFICSLMPNSGSTQIQTTPNINSFIQTIL